MKPLFGGFFRIAPLAQTDGDGRFFRIAPFANALDGGF